MHSNKITGSIPTQLGALNQLATLTLHLNQLTGPIPSEVSNLTALRQL